VGYGAVLHDAWRSRHSTRRYTTSRRRQRRQQVVEAEPHSAGLKFKQPSRGPDQSDACHLILKHYDGPSGSAGLLPFVKQSLPGPLRFLSAAEPSGDHPLLVELAGRGLTETSLRHWVEERFYQTIPIDVLALPFQDSEAAIRNPGSWLLVKHYQNMIIRVSACRSCTSASPARPATQEAHRRHGILPEMLANPTSCRPRSAWLSPEGDREARGGVGQRGDFQDFKSLPEMVLFSAETTIMGR
jgi:hypothetical protein